MDLNKIDNNHKECGSILDGLSPKCGAILAPIIAAILAEGLNSNQIAALGSFTNSVGDALSYIAAQMQLNEGLISSDSQK